MSSLYGSSDSCAYASDYEDENVVPQGAPVASIDAYMDSIEDSTSFYYPDDTDDNSYSEEEEEQQQQCCFVLDTNTLLEADHVQWQKILNAAEKHLVIIPQRVHRELCNIDEGKAGVSVRKLLTWIEKAEGDSMKKSQSSTAANKDYFPRGLRKQTSKEHCKSVTCVARNNDDHILSCASYFQRLNDKNKRKGNMKVYLVTGDVVLSLKAHAEGVETISAFS
ncbi:PIN domain [Trypanosoma melophagium]|uniref:PIN domain n=1 Tax=Trypanosoma melophagium TaxID=715481 RepID=UPI00351A7007|nr:PIN domain [Trypanosoma melophagium]